MGSKMNQQPKLCMLMRCKKRNTKFSVYEAGLVANPSLPYLGASKDSKVFDPSEREQFGFLEINAPFAWRNSNFLEACHDSNFMCFYDVIEGKAKLKVNHKIWVLCSSSGSVGLVRIAMV